MPIKPENRHRYPANWKEVRAAILRRAGNRCETPGCRVGNGWIGYRRDDGYFVLLARDGEGKPDDYAGHATGWRVFRIVLTVAHLDHQPENCDPANLRALCQRCHLQYDAEHHQRNAAATRRAGRAVGDLFGSAAAAGPVHAVPDPDHEILGLAEPVAEGDLEAAVDQAVSEGRAAVGGGGCGAGRRGERDGAGGGDFDHGQLSPLPMVVPPSDMGSRDQAVKGGRRGDAP